MSELEQLLREQVADLATRVKQLESAQALVSDFNHDLAEQLASAQTTCSKLHDLNYMQAQRIEALEARLKNAGTSLHDTRNFDAMSVALNSALMQAETRAKRCYELEQRVIELEGENADLEQGCNRG